MTRAPTTIVLENLQSRGCTRSGIHHPGHVAHGHHAEVAPRRFIRLYGIDRNGVGGPMAYDRTFRVGDVAEYDSYNLHYLGMIVALGEKTVTIEEDTGATHRLTVYEFSWRNRTVDLDQVAERNRDALKHC